MLIFPTSWNIAELDIISLYCSVCTVDLSLAETVSETAGLPEHVLWCSLSHELSKALSGIGLAFDILSI